MQNIRKLICFANFLNGFSVKTRVLSSRRYAGAYIHSRHHIFSKKMPKQLFFNRLLG
jgi:hypothetical protein